MRIINIFALLFVSADAMMASRKSSKYSLILKNVNYLTTLDSAAARKHQMLQRLLTGKSRKVNP
jgi:hypothetical protein